LALGELPVLFYPQIVELAAIPIGRLTSWLALAGQPSEAAWIKNPKRGAQPMSCADMRVLLHGMLDHELDLADAVRVETHMQVCPRLYGRVPEAGALRTAIRRSEPRYRAPQDLRARVITAIRLQTDMSCRAPWWRGAVTAWMGTRVSLALAASLLFVIAMPGEQAIQQELISGHVRSLLASISRM
jgi:anti-sigma factor RsiW